MELTRTTITLPKEIRPEFIKDVPEAVEVEGVTYIREDIVQKALKTKFENSQN